MWVLLLSCFGNSIHLSCPLLTIGEFRHLRVATRGAAPRPCEPLKRLDRNFPIWVCANIADNTNLLPNLIIVVYTNKSCLYKHRRSPAGASPPDKHQFIYQTMSSRFTSSKISLVKHHAASFKLGLKSFYIKCGKIIGHCRRHACRLSCYRATGNNSHYVPKSFIH